MNPVTIPPSSPSPPRPSSLYESHLRLRLRNLVNSLKCVMLIDNEGEHQFGMEALSSDTNLYRILNVRVSVISITFSPKTLIGQKSLF